jgi:hypothetical protein
MSPAVPSRAKETLRVFTRIARLHAHPLSELYAVVTAAQAHYRMYDSISRRASTAATCTVIEITSARRIAVL